jgi:hypothetical protein
MARKSNAALSPHNLTHHIASVWGCANGDPTPETSTLFKSVPHVLGLAEEDQAKFLDKVDQVWEDGSPSVLKAFIHSPGQGISHPRLTKCKIYIRLGGSMRRDQAPSNFCCHLRGDRDMRRRPLFLQNLCGHVARKVRFDASGHQCPSLPFHQKCGGGKGGERAVNVGGPPSS